MAEYLRDELSECDIHGGITSDEVFLRFADLQKNPSEERDYFKPSWRRMSPFDMAELMKMFKKMGD